MNPKPVLATALSCALAGCASAPERVAIHRFVAQPAVLDEPNDEGPPARVDSLQDLLRATALSSPELRAAYHDARSVALRIPASRQLPAPMLTYAGFLSAVETRVGPQLHRFGLAQAIPWPGKLSRGSEVQVAQAEALWRVFEARRAALLRDVRVPWSERAHLLRTQAILREDTQVLADLEEAMRARLEVGQGQYSDLIRLEIRRAELGEHIIALGDRALRIEAELRALAGLAPETPLPTPLPAAATSTLAPALIDPAALAQNPELTVAIARIEAAQRRARRAEASRLPDFQIGAAWTVVGEARVPGVPDSGKDAVMLTAGIRLPVWLGAYDAEEASDRAAARAAEARRDQVMARAHALQFKLRNRHQAALRRVHLFSRQLVPAAQSALDTTLSSFSAGEASFTNLVELERQLLDYRVSLSAAHAEAEAVVAELERLVGAEVTR